MAAASLLGDGIRRNSNGERDGGEWQRRLPGLCLRSVSLADGKDCDVQRVMGMGLTVKVMVATRCLVRLCGGSWNLGWVVEGQCTKGARAF
ncbi:unnamed protein product [Cuscuta campestris]|uniref:Uncharacterized protein n=1 Tax=Cuscuta campestris TaxID=132261 RepID=A0A484MMQ5_9ASTE|nr:unnamed protein product [Cuscuta campestris]